MSKGHLIFLSLFLFCMATLPAVAITREKSTALTTSSVVQTQEKGERVSLLLTDTDQVTSLSVEDYLFGVVAAEMPANYPEEAIKAQTVAAYTLLCVRRQDKSEAKAADITDDSGTDQGYISRDIARAKWGAQADTNEKKLTACIATVVGKRVLYKGELATTAYHSLSAGRTESAEVVWGKAIPYLVPVESVGDLLCEHYISNKDFTIAQLADALKTKQKSPVVGDISHSSSGTVTAVTLCGKEYTGGQVRSLLGLRSANFDVEESDGKVIFTVRGYGHQVGMSQFGAKTMAEQGSSYEEILRWYYKGCEIA